MTVQLVGHSVTSCKWKENWRYVCNKQIAKLLISSNQWWHLWFT